MHKYNNQDHSMLTAMMAVENIIEWRHYERKHLDNQHRNGLPREKSRKSHQDSVAEEDKSVH